MAGTTDTSMPGPQMGSGALPWGFFGIGGAALGLYIVVPALSEFVVLAVSVLAIVAVISGTRRHESGDRRRPWYAMAGGMAFFVNGSILRAIVPGATASPPGIAAMLVDASVLPGYLCVAYCLLQMLQRRLGAKDRLAHADGLLAGVAAALLTWSLWLAPRLEADLYTAPQLVSTTYPLVDVVLLFVTARLVAAEGVRRPALWLLTLSMTMVFIVDLAYALFAAGAPAQVLRLFDMGFILAYAAMGAAALHPTMPTLCDPQRVITSNAGLARAVGLAAVVMAPAVLATLVPASTVWDKAIRVSLAAVLAFTVIARVARSQASQANAEAVARYRSTHDALTELPNRELLTATVTTWCDHAISNDQEISLVFLDLDRFKQVNDSWGHRIGDELLCTVAGRLSTIVRKEDLVCRLGGDEFVIALASPSHSALAVSLAARLLEAFHEPFTLSVGEVTVTPSIGVVRTDGTTEALELIRDADLAMYQAKDSGGNTYALFDESLRDRARARVELEQALRGALGRGELSVNYQPIVDAASGELSGFEALMRWTHPELGVVPPDRFIPVAEATGLIVASGAWLLDEALDQLARWQRDRDVTMPPLHMSVNIATRQLRDADLVSVVHKALERTGLPSSALWLEVTESVLLKDADLSRATLDSLRDLGVTLCIDDFGTGYASLSYVREIPAEITKIDKRFIDGIGTECGDEAIVIAVIAMAHAVGQRVVAEGVETLTQRDWLAERGCDLIQGWLYGRPQPAGAQHAWSRRSLQPLVPNAAVAAR